MHTNVYVHCVFAKSKGDMSLGACRSGRIGCTADISGNRRPLLCRSFRVFFCRPERSPTPNAESAIASSSSRSSSTTATSMRAPLRSRVTMASSLPAQCYVARRCIHGSGRALVSSLRSRRTPTGSKFGNGRQVPNVEPCPTLHQWAPYSGCFPRNPPPDCTRST